MTDNKRFKINAYIQILRYVDDAYERKIIVDTVCDLLDMIPNFGKGGSSVGRPPICKSDCINLLDELFSADSEIPAIEILDILHKKGFSDRVIKESKEELGIQSKHVGRFGVGHWVWILKRGTE